MAVTLLEQFSEADIIPRVRDRRGPELRPAIGGLRADFDDRKGRRGRPRQIAADVVPIAARVYVWAKRLP
jgi:hypothetical protein